jgi:hypothetical protein
MPPRLHRRALAALAALSALASPALAQPAAGFLNTGVGAAGATTDAVWSVTATRVSTGATLYSGAARTITGIPGEWADNQPGIARWIGATTSGTLAAPGAAGDNARRFRYVFGATFDLTGFAVGPQSTLSFRFGADNYFDPVARGLGVRLNGGAWLDPITLAACEGKFGFDRNGSGCFTVANGFLHQMSGTVAFDGELLASNALNTIEFATEGDGQTDGLFITESRLDGVTAVVPEPSTYVLLATGLGVIGVVVRRRR